jgi:hypothetical protein
VDATRSLPDLTVPANALGPAGATR